ncbi:MAG: hypothetical protein JO235_02050 [Chroococcidiopsidaceae cyanobacterium CP_BM_RX_35]|nr:hypothetical protein [Chroococcidiopsidaceae cyanobacterium CP_BM_RX_35]
MQKSLNWNWNNLITYTALGLMVSLLGWHQSRKTELATVAEPVPLTSASNPPAALPNATSPRLLKFSLSLSSPKELKVKQGDTVRTGEAIADRVEERVHLTAQRQALVLSLQEIQGKTAIKPTAPVTVPSVNELPPISYAEEEAAIASARMSVQQAQKEFDREQERLKSAPLEESSAVRKAEVTVAEKQRAVDLQNRKIDAVQGLKDLPPDVIVHEQEVLKQKQADLKLAQADLEQAQAKEQAASKQQSDKLQQLSQAVEKAQSELQLAISKLQTAHDKRAYTEYEASVAAARRVEEHNQAEQNYTRQLQEAEQHERDRSFQVTQIQDKIAAVDNQLSALSTVRSPYAGTIRLVKILGQNDKNLSVEITLAVGNGNDSTPGLSSGTKPTGGAIK